MTPYMAQGAATSIEDAAVLARCLDGVDNDDIEGAFQPLRGAPQAAHVAHPGDLERQHLDAGGNEDTAWLYGYDAWTVPLVGEDDMALAG